MYDIIIIGAGPAGMTASIYARRANKSVLVLEAISYGGQIINSMDVDNYPSQAHISGFDLATKMYNQAKDLGVKFIFEKAIDIKNEQNQKEVITEKNKYLCKSVIIATGLINRNLGLDNEKNLIGKGISYCATCDGAFYKNMKVAVVGGGETALEDAIYLSKMASKVYLIHRNDSFTDNERLSGELKKTNVEVLFNTTITKINGKDKLESIEIKLDGQNSTLEIDCLFVAIGKMPENNNFTKFADTDKIGYIVAGEDCRTKTDGIFVAGDVRSKKLRQLVTATSDGAIAATEAIKYINRLEEK